MDDCDCCKPPSAASLMKSSTQPAHQHGDTKSAPQLRSLFNGKTLENWKVVEYAGAGDVTVQDGNILFATGERLTGIAYTGDMPTTNYEISLKARKLEGSDFFAGITFPIDKSFATFVLGGWGGSLCGVSSIDGDDAAHNDFKTFQRFDNNVWYNVRLRVTTDKLQAWLDKEQILDIDTRGKKFDIRADVDDSKPMGIAAFQTKSEIKDITLTKIEGK